MYRKIYKQRSDYKIKKNDKIQIPYNPNNRLITAYDVQKIMEKLGVKVQVKEIEVYRRAMTHKSYVYKSEFSYDNIPDEYDDIIKKSIPLQKHSNERLEFLGDTYIKCIFSTYLVQRYPNEGEGYMTRLKMKMENRESLARLGKRIGLDKFLILSIQIEETSSRTSDKLLEDAFEAFVGALVLDQGFDKIKEFLTYLLENEFDWSDLLYNDNNYKDALMRYYHSQNWSHPLYKDISHRGPTNMRKFKAGALDKNGIVIGTGYGASKRAAQQAAAKKALIYFNQLNQDQIMEEDIEII